MARQNLLTLLFAVTLWAYCPAQITQRLPRFQKHFVRERETPSSIAHDFNLRTKDFLMLNNFPEDVRLKPGQEVLIRQLKEGETAPKESAYVPRKSEIVSPASEETVKERTETEKPKAVKQPVTIIASPSKETNETEMLVGPNGAKYQLTGGSFHVVQKGQTFYRIALIYHLSIDELKKLNNMTTTDIKVGQELRVSK